MAAYHDGGPQHGQFYDSDFGGARYADGDEAMKRENCPEISRAKHREAKALGWALPRRIRCCISFELSEGVSPLRGAGLLRCASSRWQRPSVSPLTGVHPSRESSQAGATG